MAKNGQTKRIKRGTSRSFPIFSFLKLQITQKQKVEKVTVAILRFPLFLSPTLFSSPREASWGNHTGPAREFYQFFLKMCSHNCHPYYNNHWVIMIITVIVNSWPPGHPALLSHCYHDHGHHINIIIAIMKTTNSPWISSSKNYLTIKFIIIFMTTWASRTAFSAFSSSCLVCLQ